MNSKNLTSILLLIAVILTATSVNFSVSVTFFKENSVNSKSTDPMFLGESLELSADDGVKFYIQEIDEKYMDQKPYARETEGSLPDHFFLHPERCVVPIIYIPIEDSVCYALLCEDKDQILDITRLPKDFFTRDDLTYELKISKKKEYENVTTYSLDLEYAYIDDNEAVSEKAKLETKSRSSMVWIDNKDKKYCGSFEYPPFPFLKQYHSDPAPIAWDMSFYTLFIHINYDELNKYYFHLEDYFLEVLEEQFDEFRQSIGNNEYDYFSLRGITIMYLILACDFETWKNTNEEFKALELEMYAVVNRIKTAERLSHYTQYIDAIITEYEQYGEKLSVTQKQAMEQKPKFETQLPTNEEELAEYLAWMLNLRNPAWKKFYDAYNTEIKFELTEEGLQATSAGSDKIFDTEDDIVFVREFK